MTTDWRATTLGDLEVESNGVIQTGPFGSQLHMSDYSDLGTPVVMPTNIKDLRIDPADIARVADGHVERLSRHQLRPGDIVYSRRGDVEKCALIRVDESGWLCGTGCLLVRVGGPEVDNRFLAYSLSQPETRAWISMRAVGATMPNLNTGILREVPVMLPPIAEQQGIAATLGALDDKIESNRRAIDVAEQLADALFAEVANTTETLSGIAEIVMGSSPPGASYNEDGLGMPFYQGIRDFGRRYPRYRVWTTDPVRTAEPNDTLLSVRAPVGTLNRSRGECCIGRGLAAVRSPYESTVFYALRAAADVWQPFQNEGTVFGAINRTDLATATIPWPSNVGDCDEMLSALDKKIQSLDDQIESLTDLRHALLPALFSGRVRVPEAEHRLSGVDA